MSRTPNHGYNVPDEGDEDWHRPLNENFEAYDTDIELRDEEANLDDYEPTAGAKFLATDTGVVYVADGSDWLATFQAGRYTPPSDTSNAGGVASGDPANEASGDGATVAGGQANEAINDHCTVGGGQDNSATRIKATIGGGQANSADGNGATVGGGTDNTAKGDWATVVGGRENLANGTDSFAAGRRAEARHPGSFVWSNSDSRFVDTDDGQFLVDATGGVGIGTQSPDAPFHVRGSDDPALDGDVKVGSDDYRFTAHVETDGSDAGMVRLRARGKGSDDYHRLRLGAGPNDVVRISGKDDGALGFYPAEDDAVVLGWGGSRWASIDVKTVYADSVSETSDARLKTNVSSLEGGLERVSSLRPVSFEWEDEERSDGAEIGLIAQEVEEVIPEVVERRNGDEEDDSLSVQYTKLVPVLIDAVQRQQEGIEERDERVERLESENERKDERIDDLEERLATLEAQVDHVDAAPAGD